MIFQVSDASGGINVTSQGKNRFNRTPHCLVIKKVLTENLRVESVSIIAHITDDG